MIPAAISLLIPALISASFIMASIAACEFPSSMSFNTCLIRGSCITCLTSGSFIAACALACSSYPPWCTPIEIYIFTLSLPFKQSAFVGSIFNPFSYASIALWNSLRSSWIFPLRAYAFTNVGSIFKHRSQSSSASLNLISLMYANARFEKIFAFFGSRLTPSS